VTVVFLHGNPTSSYLWRNVLPLVEPLADCLAPDLLGMGAAPRRPGSRYRYAEHRAYLDEVLAGLDDVVLVGHDWGGVLAMDRARRHPATVRGIAYLETMVGPVSWADPNAPDRALFGALRSPAGEDMVLRDNVFVETILPAGTVRTLTPAEHDAYRAPFRDPGEGRRPMLTWPREIPIDGEPADVHAVVVANAAFMATSPVPKLLVVGDPGAVLTGPALAACRRWPNQTEVTVPGTHFLPEDSPEQIGRALAAWLP
jgi:haloalkane dehalogenase